MDTVGADLGLVGVNTVDLAAQLAVRHGNGWIRGMETSQDQALGHVGRGLLEQVRARPIRAPTSVSRSVRSIVRSSPVLSRCPKDTMTWRHAR